ncbi:hypothetical protein M427DRAFT_33693 [Gonapodya prolifera JEL478]|uniref:Spherulation-specific family 4 n=1 Tax=Gonapodya prolifera (strain JEL478) TaxID=1344416 RepID=A0A139AAF2_GONPJ|nr:hypothetical protein M427DRAFT_33693 [Gonapodya prolifera JEL478]|eukprot:KXS13720.1 hypothetical protein M427DRAFT_33693 [Gonapodya prolifera JEL478]
MSYQNSNVGIIFPLYVYPTPEAVAGVWSPVAQASHTVPVIAIVNPNSGPGDSQLPDASYQAAIKAMRSQGNGEKLLLLGYVALTYGKRPFEEVVGDIRKYGGWNELSGGALALDGIFFDEMPSASDAEQPYPHSGDFGGRPHVLSTFTQSMAAFTRSLRWRNGRGAVVVTNPGVLDVTASDFAGTFGGDVTMAFETTAAEWKQKNGSEVARLLAGRQGSNHPAAVAIHSIDQKSVAKTARQLRSLAGVRYVFVSDRVMPNPYDALPSGWNEIIQALA